MAQAFKVPLLLWITPSSPHSESYIKIKLWEIIKPSYMNVFFIIRVLKFFFITALRPAHRLLLCSLQKASLQFLLTWRERNTVHREESSSLLASIPLSSARLAVFTTAALQEPSGAGGVTGRLTRQVCRRQVTEPGVRLSSPSLIPSALALGFCCSRYTWYELQSFVKPIWNSLRLCWCHVCFISRRVRSLSQSQRGWR